MKTRFFTIISLAAILSIISEAIFYGVAIWAYSRAHPNEDTRFLILFRAFHAPGVITAFHWFPILADMDDHDTGKEGGTEDILGTSIMFVIPLIQWFIIWLGGIWLLKKVNRLASSWCAKARPDCAA